ncbi:MAG TPA: HNH endonuclease [Bdellovibrio sp.]
MTSLNNISNAELISRIEKLARTERKITHLILLHVAEIEDRKLYAELGYDSIYTYLTRGLGYSEGAAHRRVQSARLLKKTPEISQRIEDGSLNLSQLAQVQKCLKEHNNSDKGISYEATLNILEKLENKNNFETEKVLALAFDRPVQTFESVKPQQDDSVRLQITLTKEQFAELEQAKSLLSHICHEGHWADVIGALAKIYNDKKLKGRIKGGTSAVPKNNSNNPQVLASQSTQSASATESKRPRKYISVHLKRNLLRKANNCCVYINPITNLRCNSKYKLQIDHIQAWSKGGTDHPSNLAVLCQAHNLFKSYG